MEPSTNCGVLDMKSKRQCCKKQETKDRISNLPDEVLCYILSLVPTLFAVRTCILAKRWSHLWTFVDCYDFSYSMHQWRLEEKGKDFIAFGDMVFKNSNVSSIRKFGLSSLWDYHFLDISKLFYWVCTAISRNVRELDLSIRTKGPIELPHGLFTCQTLVVLRLSSTYFVKVPDFVWFSSLKILRISQWRCLLDDPMKNILAGCPALEELCLQAVIFENLQRLCIRCITLKRLMMWILYPKVLKENLEHDIVIEAPQLEYLDIKDCHSKGLEIKELPILTHANIYFFRFGLGASEFLTKISNVEHLLLFPKAGMSIHHVPNTLPTLSNLTRLEIHIVDSWQFMSPLLECSPNLDVLICEKESRCTLHKGRPVSICMWHPPASVPKCLSCLTRIEIRFNGCDNEMQLVSYLLKNATVLRTMVIAHSPNFVRKWESRILKELLAFPRGSVACQVKFQS